MRTSSKRLLVCALAVAAGIVAAWVGELHGQAATGDPPLLERRAGLSVDDVSVEAALTRLQRTSGARLAFSPSLLPQDHRVRCVCADLTVRAALARILQGTSLRFGEHAGQVVIEPRLATPEAEAPRTATVRGTVMGDDDRPAMGVLITLEDGSGHSIRSTLSEADGGFSLTSVRPGAYRVRAERIGYRPGRTDPFTVEGLAVELPIRLAGEPIPIEALELDLRAERRYCSLRADEATAVAELWRQARQAFSRVELTQREGRVPLRMARYERRVEIGTGRVLSEAWTAARPGSGPFWSLPAEDLIANGWVRWGADGRILYYAPDPSVLLSEAFREGFCFGIRSDPSSARVVGLAFEPVRPTSAPSVQGVLWIDRETAEIERLEFQYTGHLHEPAIPASLFPLFGGELEFRALPDGRWVVERWSLRMPELRRTARFTEAEHAAAVRLRDADEGTYQIVQRAPGVWRDRILRGDLVFHVEGGELKGR